MPNDAYNARFPFTLLKRLHMTRSYTLTLCLSTIGLVLSATFLNAQDASITSATKQKGSIRFATFNVALNRKKKDELNQELSAGNSQAASKIAAIIQSVRPDVLLINEIDYDGGKSVEAFEKLYLAKGQHGRQPIEYAYRYVGAVNTGVDASVDINSDGETGGPQDAFGFGWFPGQYGMAVLSMHRIDTANVRTFQKFLWQDMPNALLPTKPGTTELWYSPDAMKVFRLSSKSHWDLPIRTDSGTIHLLASHPTPPVFDEEEDRNGKRNHDEIRLWADYVSSKADYLYDDKGIKGGLADDQMFVIAGDLNADPNDGDSTAEAVDQLLKNPKIQSSPVPSSNGGKHYAEKEGGANKEQTGDPLHDTSNFNDRTVGNMRIDYVLPSVGLTVTGSGVFWPAPGEEGNDLSDVSDHRLVWIDIKK